MAMFARYEGIDGESKDENHENWIDLLSLEWAVSAPEGGGGRRRAAAEVEPMVLAMEYEKAAPKLLERSLKGSVVPTLEIELTSTYGGARATYLRYELKNVRVTAYDVEASGNDEAGPPVVLVANEFEEIKVTYSEFDDSGSNLGNVETEYKARAVRRAEKARSKKKKKK